MKFHIIIGRFNKMGGTRTFFKNLINFYEGTNINLIIFLEDLDDLEISNFLTQKNYVYTIIKIPKFSKTEVINRFLSNIYIKWKIYKQKISPEKIIYSDWNIIYDFITLTNPLESLYFVHTYPNRKLPYAISNFNRILISVGKKKIVTVSNYSKKRILEKWLDIHNETSNLVEFIYNYSDLEIEQMDKSPNIKILTLGHVREYKNPELWLKIAEKVTNTYPSVTFTWAGEGELLDSLRMKNNKPDQIQFIGYTDKVKELYSTASIYLQLSKRESQGIAVLDAMRNSIPTIVSGEGGLPESVENGSTGFIVDINSEEKIVEKIIELIDKPDLRHYMAINSKDLYELKFSKKVWSKKMTRLILN